MADTEKGKLPYKLLNVTITTNDPVVAEVLASARKVKRLNAVLGMMLEAYVATPEGRVWAAQQLRVPLSELPLLPDVAGVPAPATSQAAVAAQTPPAESVPGHTSPSRSAINLDAICTA